MRGRSDRPPLRRTAMRGLAIDFSPLRDSRDFRLLWVDQPARSATVPRLVSRDKLPAALSLQQVLYQVSQVAGPSVGGLVIARFGLPYAYAVDTITFGVALVTLFAMSPQPPSADAARP